MAHRRMATEEDAARATDGIVIAGSPVRHTRIGTDRTLGGGRITSHAEPNRATRAPTLNGRGGRACLDGSPATTLLPAAASVRAQFFSRTTAALATRRANRRLRALLATAFRMSGRQSQPAWHEFDVKAPERNAPPRTLRAIRPRRPWRPPLMPTPTGPGSHADPWTSESPLLGADS
eukprot:scaffold22078_cov33-Tisochrysis_lutea.AAC.7